MEEFVAFPKISRFSRDVIITEKIDGTNAQIFIAEDCQPILLDDGKTVPFLCGSRKNYIYPWQDNHGFAGWAFDNVDELLKLGPGRHFGEWWGKGIQRGYGLTEKKFSLFNTSRWSWVQSRPTCCDVIPVLWSGPMDKIGNAITDCLALLALEGSVAAPGFMQPEGVVVHHVAANISFKKTLKNDEKHKGEI